MSLRILSLILVLCLLEVSNIPSQPVLAGRQQTSSLNSTNERAQSSAPSEQRDETLWKKALAIHRKAIVIDTHNDITTPMTNDDYDLGGAPPVPYRTSIERMKEGGLTAEFFSLYIRPWYVQHGGAARRTLDMIDSVY